MSQLGKQRYCICLILLPSCTRTSQGSTPAQQGPLAQAESHPFLAPEGAGSETAEAHLCSGSDTQYCLFEGILSCFVWVHLWEHTVSLKEICMLLVFADVMAAQ